MSNKPFIISILSPQKDDTEYYLLTSDYVSVAEFEGQEIVKVAPQSLNPAGSSGLLMMRRLCCVPHINSR